MFFFFNFNCVKFFPTLKKIKISFKVRFVNLLNYQVDKSALSTFAIALSARHYKARVD